MTEQPTTEERVAFYLAAKDHLCAVDQADPEYREIWWKNSDPKFRADYLAYAREVIAIVDPAQADPPEFAGGQHWWIDCQRGGARWGLPGSHDRDSELRRLAELRAAHPDTVYRLVCDTTRSAVEDA